MTWLIIVGIIVVVLVVLVMNRMRANRNDVRLFISQMCAEAGVDDTPFNVGAYVSNVLQGRLNNDLPSGSYWVTEGIEMIGDASVTRLLDSDVADSLHEVHQLIDDMFYRHGGNALMPPHLAEGTFIGEFPGAPRDVVYARITGRYRPIGAWLVAIPASLVP